MWPLFIYQMGSTMALSDIGESEQVSNTLAGDPDFQELVRQKALLKAMRDPESMEANMPQNVAMLNSGYRELLQGMLDRLIELSGFDADRVTAAVLEARPAAVGRAAAGSA
jgi:hypothetical protein